MVHEPRVISILGGPPLWMKFANCKDHDQEMFFVKRGGRPTSGIEVCEDCPVQKKCLKYALDHGIEHGVWGGQNFSNKRSQEDQE